ncbi:MAG: hypothetical protein P8Z30_19365 [Acidobacteriota bacterium]
MDSEKLAIRALCLGTSQGPVREAILPILRTYRWQAPLHQVIFDALASIVSDDPATLRQLLPAKLTRLGFPDVEWEEFFTPLSLSRDETIAMVRRMVAGQRPS